MCGLVGVAGDIHLQTHGKMFRDMLIFDTVRGMDSTGIATVGLGTGGKPAIQKDLGGPTNLFENATGHLVGPKGLPRMQTKCLIGHNRSATFGQINIDNAHPFQYGHITGAHNGTLTDWHELVGFKENDVDSKSIFMTIEEKGIDYCWKSFRGDTAIVYWDSNKSTLNFVRNDGRTLYYCMNKEKNVIMWASEMWMITVGASRNKIELETVKDKDGKLVYNIVAFKPNHLHVFDIGATSVTLEEVRELEKKSPPQGPTVGYGIHYPKTGMNTGGHVKNWSKSKEKPPLTKINMGWSADTEKAPKEVRGSHVVLDYYIEGVSDKPMHYIVGYIPDSNGLKGERITIYPATYGEYLIWKDRVDVGKKTKRYKLCARPRMTTNDLNNVWKEYRIAANHVKFAENAPEVGDKKETPVKQETVVHHSTKKDNVECIYKGPDGRMMSEKEFNIALKIVSKDGCCTGCGNPIDVKDADELLWYEGTVVFCEECQKNEVIMGYLNMAVKGA